MRTRPGQVEPEIYFRIVHAAQIGLNAAPVATYREQTVESVLPPRKPALSGDTGVFGQMMPAGIESWPVPCRVAANGIGVRPASTR